LTIHPATPMSQPIVRLLYQATFSGRHSRQIYLK
jgi:hypothetical protein